jgi:hypothetical protein
MATRRIDNPELIAMSDIAAVLDGLGRAQRQRVLDWLGKHYGEGDVPQQGTPPPQCRQLGMSDVPPREGD